MRKRTLLSWSSGKDSAWTLHLLRQDPQVEVTGLFTTLNQTHDRVSMHATRAELLHRQARAAGLPVRTLALPDPCPNARYEEIMGAFVAECLAAGVTHMAFGDLYLEDVRAYRERQLAATGIEALFPLWGLPTDELAGRMLDAGVEAWISCVDLSRLPARFAGRRWTGDLIGEFPPGVDPCGENGEFHTIMVAGPMLRHGIEVQIGEVVERGGFAYADVIPVQESGSVSTVKEDGA